MKPDDCHSVFVPLRRVRFPRAGLEESASGSSFNVGSRGSSSMVCPMDMRFSLFMRSSLGPVSLASTPPFSKEPSPEMTAGTRLLRKSMFHDFFCLLFWCVVQLPVPCHSPATCLLHLPDLQSSKQTGTVLSSSCSLHAAASRTRPVRQALRCALTDLKRRHLSGFLKLSVWTN